MSFVFCELSHFHSVLSALFEFQPPPSYLWQCNSGTYIYCTTFCAKFTIIEH